MRDDGPLLSPTAFEQGGFAALFHSGTREVLDYWEALRVAGHVPERAALDFACLPEQAPLLFLAEFAPPKLPLRHAGELWRRLWGGGLKERDMLGLFAGSRDATSAYLAATIAAGQGEPMVLNGTLDFEDGRTPVEILFAPMRGVSERIDRLFGLLQPSDAIEARLLQGGPPRISVKTCRPAGQMLAVWPTIPPRHATSDLATAQAATNGRRRRKV